MYAMPWSRGDPLYSRIQKSAGAGGAAVRMNWIVRWSCCFVTSGNQFGMSEADVTECIRDREKFPHVTMVGLQYFTRNSEKNHEKRLPGK